MSINWAPAKWLGLYMLFSCSSQTWERKNLGTAKLIRRWRNARQGIVYTFLDSFFLTWSDSFFDASISSFIYFNFLTFFYFWFDHTSKTRHSFSPFSSFYQTVSRRILSSFNRGFQFFFLKWSRLLNLSSSSSLFPPIHTILMFQFMVG